MTASPDIEAQKRAAAEAAVGEVASSMVVGLGTGTTAAYAIAALGQRIMQGLRIEAVATSLATAAAAERAGIVIRDFAAFDAIDLAIDGVDEIDPSFRAIKGGGGAMLREKAVAAAAARMIAIGDVGKQVAALGARPVPVETLPFAAAFVMRRLRETGARVVLRLDGAGQPFRTDQANLVIDCFFDAIPDPASLAAAIEAIPGALGHGLFLDEIDCLYVGSVTGVKRLDRKRGSGNRASRREHP